MSFLYIIDGLLPESLDRPHPGHSIRLDRHFPDKLEDSLGKRVPDRNSLGDHNENPMFSVRLFGI